MQTRSSDDNYVCPSVCLSVCPSAIRVICDNERQLSVVFREDEWVGGGDPLYLKIWLNRPRWSEIDEFEPIIARRASAVTPSEKSTRFPMSLR